MHPDRDPVSGKRCRAPVLEDESGSSQMTTIHTKPGRVLDHTPAAMLRRMGDGSARALKKVVSVKHPEMYDVNLKALKLGRDYE